MKVFRLFKLEQMFFGIQSVDTVARCTTSYLLAGPAVLVTPCWLHKHQLPSNVLTKLALQIIHAYYPTLQLLIVTKLIDISDNASQRGLTEYVMSPSASADYEPKLLLPQPQLP